jgi:hypothetical protein
MFDTSIMSFTWATSSIMSNNKIFFLKLHKGYVSLSMEVRISYIKATVVFVCLSVCLSVVTNRAGQGRAARADTRPLDLLAARSNRMGGFLTVQTSNLHPNKNIYNKKTIIFLKKIIETK